MVGRCGNVFVIDVRYEFCCTIQFVIESWVINGILEAIMCITKKMKKKFQTESIVKMNKYITAIGTLLVSVSAQNCGPTAGNARCMDASAPCCSQYGWCGITTAHCSTGCQPLFGMCGAVAPPPVSGNCGPTAGNARCSGTECCSQYGWCGTTSAHCEAGCQSLFGTCGTPPPPPPPPQPTIITECTTANSIAITYDDGPYLYTTKLLDILRANRVKATFFVNGKNRNDINDPTVAAVIQRAFREGHQIGHHTWSHADLTTLSNTQIQSEMTQLSDALQRLISRRPRHFRPPYGALNSNVQTLLSSWGYKVITWNLDTNDWRTPDTAPNVTAVFNGVNPMRKIVLMHDTLQYTVEPFTQNLINFIRQRGLNMLTVAECLGESGYF